MITNRLELLSDVGLFRPKGIPECILPTPKFEQEQEKVGFGVSTCAIVAKVKTEFDEAMKGNM